MKVNFLIEVLSWLVIYTPFALEYPSLYDIVHREETLEASTLGAHPLNIQFGGALTGDKWTMWKSFKV